MLHRLAYDRMLTETTHDEYGITLTSRQDFRPFIFERPVVASFIKEIQSADVFFDIGAYHGFYSLLASSQSTNLVYAFEPNEENREVLYANVRQNDVGETITVVPKVVFSTETEVQIRPDDAKTTVGVGNETVKTTTIDAFCSQTVPDQTPDVLKIDVEGAEFEVLAGAKKTLQQKPVLFVEIHHQSSGSFRSGDIEESLSGYAIEILLERETETIVLARPEEHR